MYFSANLWHALDATAGMILPDVDFRTDFSPFWYPCYSRNNETQWDRWQFLPNFWFFLDFFVFLANLERPICQKNFLKCLSHQLAIHFEIAKQYLPRNSPKIPLSDGQKLRFFKISANFDLNFRGQGVQIAKNY